MNKLKTLSLVLSVFYFSSFSQKISYGVILGANAYDIEVKGDLAGGTGNSELNYGLFAEYQLNNHFGIRANIISNKATERHGYDVTFAGASSRIFETVTLNTLQFHTLLKYSLDYNYKEKMYLTGGLRITSILNEQAKKDQELLDGFYKKTNFGFLLGFGGNILKHFNLELLGDYGFSNALDSDDYKTQNLGGYINLYINIESIINKK